MGPFRVFIGYDPREDAAYEVCRFSMLRRASVALEVQPLKLSTLRETGYYSRPEDPKASTEFSYSRFLVPALAGYRGHALFCDCDFLWLADVANLIALVDDSMAVQCVHHDYRPPEKIKMDGRPQSQYPRKNWSSLMLFNCGHPSTQRLTVDRVNAEHGSYLHGMQWADDSEIGSLPGEWNWLEGWNKLDRGMLPKAVHFTRGGPWFEQWKSVEFSDAWAAEHKAMELDPIR
ncbi:MAG TPA: hypothetical protein VFW94_04130 [Candidatus Acidoferrales bacterium]|nr:hypothetical protein [Candidatus Acidoferrales bacterium]